LEKKQDMYHYTNTNDF